MATGLVALGLVPTPPAAVSTERERFEQRFGCFRILVQPAALDYPQVRSLGRRNCIPGELVCGA